MPAALEVLFTPAEFAALRDRDLSETVCVVFDVLRATSTMVTALGHGATAIMPVAEISEAVQVRRSQPGVLLAGERDGRRIPASLAEGIEFDLGNSPRDFTSEKVRGKTIVMTTTNGTRALRACAHARKVFLGSFLNLRATAEFLIRPSENPAGIGGASLGVPPLGGSRAPAQLLLICSGTNNEAAYEDVLGAGAFVELLWPVYDDGAIADSARLARRLYGVESGELARAVARSRNGRRLSAQPDLRDDLPFCIQQNIFDFTASAKGPVVTIDTKGTSP